MIWLAKIVAKVVLSRLPLEYRLFSRLGVFRHGHMDDIRYAESVFSAHYNFFPQKEGWVGMELGPGDSLATAILAKIHGAKKIFLLDVGCFAKRDIAFYRGVAQRFAVSGSVGASLAEKSSNWLALEDMLRDCNATYLTGGVDSLKDIESGSIDAIWSQAVLEHVRLNEFDELIHQFSRILKLGGVGTHVIDYRDHLNYSLNSLRFRRNFWESDWFAFRSGFYTNRLRHSQVLKFLTDAGFGLDTVVVKKWSKLPIGRSKLDRAFAPLSDDDLLIWEGHVVFSR